MLRRLLIMYLVWWACFFVVAALMQAGGGLVHLSSAALAPIMPLLLVGKAIEQDGVGVAVLLIAFASAAPIAIGIAAVHPGKPALARVARVSIAFYWVVMFGSMSLGS